MEPIWNFLTSTPILAIFISLAIGYCIGIIKIGPITIGATIGTLIVSFTISRFATFEIPGILVTVFSVFFCFTLGYEAGPAFFKSLRSQGIKYVIQAIFFCVCALVTLTSLGLLGIIDSESLIGIAAGSLTQSSILAVAEHSTVAYAITYIFGTVLAIIFASVIGPAILRTNLLSAVKDNIKKNPRDSVKETSNPRSMPISIRAYIVHDGSKQIGRTVEEIEDNYNHILEIEKIHRNGQELNFEQETIIEADDIITVLSSTSHFINLDDEFLSETCESKYSEVEFVTKDIIITESFYGSIIDYLSKYGIILHKIDYHGKNVPISEELFMKKGTILKVSGVKTAVKKAADAIGYIREVGDATDVPFIFAALAAAILLGAIKFRTFSFGDSTCALILGLLCGWYCNRNPKVGEYPSGTRWFMKSVGLNLFIAVKGLTTGRFDFDSKLLLIIGLGIAVTLIPHIITLLFSKYVLKMDDADILGGQCGSGTCTAALNAITDSTGSTVFVTSFATTNAIANILLTIVGVVLSSII